LKIIPSIIPLFLELKTKLIGKSCLLEGREAGGQDGRLFKSLAEHPFS